MSQPASEPPMPPWVKAQLIAACLAVNPAGLGGARICGFSSPQRDAWLAQLRALLPADAPMRRVPLHITDGRLLGGLDLTATLSAGRPIAERGVLADADGGLIVLAMAERLEAGVAAKIAAVMDAAHVHLERDGLTRGFSARLGVVALDEGLTDDETLPAALVDRLAFRLDLVSKAGDSFDSLATTREDIAAARALLPGVACPDPAIAAICETAMALGIASLRACTLAVETARVAASLDGRQAVSDDDVVLAGQLVLAFRATRLPAAEEPSADETPQPQDDEAEQDDPPPEQQPSDDEPGLSLDELTEMLLEATKAAIPTDLLAALSLQPQGLRPSRSSGKAGAAKRSLTTGRPAGVRRSPPSGGARLNLIETLKAAAPWQKLRATTGLTDGAKIRVRPDDFHVTVRKDRTITTTIFVVDASGSSALNRLAEAKGAVELLLKDCYVRRDQAALIAFRGREAELILPPTRSLVRARRALAALPGGGGTPLASAIDQARALAEGLRRKGQTPAIVLLTDGRANIARDGTAGRPQARDDALASARSIAASNLRVILIDTSPDPQPDGKALAQAMKARYLALPFADATLVSRAVKLATSAMTDRP